MRRSVIVILILLLMPMAMAGRPTGQETASAELTEKLRTLQGEFDQWQQSLVAIHLEESTLDQRWLSLLNQERSTPPPPI